MRTFRKPNTAGNSPIYEKTYGEKITVPDMGMTVREIMDRFASGTLPDVHHDANYSEDMPDLRGLDISEIEQFKEHNNNSIGRYQTTLEEQIKSVELEQQQQKQLEDE